MSAAPQPKNVLMHWARTTFALFVVSCFPPDIGVEHYAKGDGA